MATQRKEGIKGLLENIIYAIVIFLFPFLLYLAVHFTIIFRYTRDEDLSFLMEVEKRYAIATIIWLLVIIAILLLFF